MNRRKLLQLASLGALASAMPGASLTAPRLRRRPNFIVILCDDLGYGDVGALGGRLIRTPNIDRMACEGAVLTDFYAAANLCTPSRAGLLTGRYPIRTGLALGVVMQNDRRGLAQSEVTIAEALKPDYAAALIGKWHLGHVAPFWPPTTQGFDLFFGLPYSHDMEPLSLFEAEAPGVELTKEDVDLPTLQQRFYERAEQFIEANRSRPFMLELALSAPHLPSAPHADHAGRSHAGAYGDVVEEIDAIVGRLLQKLRELEIDQDTLVVFTSDNGPWFEGSAGGLRQRKNGGGFEGGYRTPFIARYPGVIPAGLRSNAISMATDLLPTFCSLAGVDAPHGVQIDGRDLSSVLTLGAASPHEQLVLFDNEDVAAIRTQRWKYVYYDYVNVWRAPVGGTYPQLYDMQLDPSESYNFADRYPQVVQEMEARFRRAQQTFDPFRTAPKRKDYPV